MPQAAENQFKILFLPFSIKQQKNQIKMAELTPKIELIKAKYKGRTDQVTMQKQQQEIMELQQKEGYNPMSGCLPLLIQMPIIVFLYNVIRNPLSHICQIADEGVIAIHNLLNPEKAVDAIKAIDQIRLVSQIRNYTGGGLEGYDLSRLPDFTLFGTDLAATPSLKAISWVVLVPVVAAALTWLSMFLTRKWNQNQATQPQDAQAGASMKMMDLIMPAMTLWMAFSFSGMMGIYWAYQSALGILQTFILSKAMPLPKFTEEDYKAAEKEVFARADKSTKVTKSGRAVRSLHHIDDEDFEDTREAALKHKEALAAQEKEEKEKNAQKKSGLFSGVTLKKDDRKAEEKENNDNNNDPQDENKSEE